MGLTGSGARGSVGGVGCEGVEVRVERIDAADGFGTGCFGGAITGGPGLVGEGFPPDIGATCYVNDKQGTSHDMHCNTGDTT